MILKIRKIRILYDPHRFMVNHTLPAQPQIGAYRSFSYLAIANRSRVSCAHNTLRASRPIVTPWPWNRG